jgi:two-component system chemotaxis response regulator CheY
MTPDILNVCIKTSAQALYPAARRKQAGRTWNLNVLLIDDDEADTALIMTVLKRHPGVSTARATGAAEFALRQLTEGNQLKPDLVLLDIHMPRLDGFSFLEALRRIPSMARVPVIFLTTSALPSDLAKIKDSSASHYVIKPDSYSGLQSCLNGVFRCAASGLWNN